MQKTVLCLEKMYVNLRSYCIWYKTTVYVVRYKTSVSGEALTRANSKQGPTGSRAEIQSQPNTVQKYSAKQFAQVKP